MASHADYSVGWVCALPIEAAAAKATLDHVHDDLPRQSDSADNNQYILGSLHGHNVVVAYPPSGMYGKTSVEAVVMHLRTNFKSLNFVLLVGIAGGVPNTKEDLRLGDVVVSRATVGGPGVVQYVSNKERGEDWAIRSKGFAQPIPLLLAAVGKAETAAIFNESQMPQNIAEILRNDPVTFARPDPEQDILFESKYEHTSTTSEENGCGHCDREGTRSRQPRKSQDPRIHHGIIATGPHLIRNGETRDKLVSDRKILCLDTEAAGLNNVAQFLVIRGVCDYADSHRSELWHGYAALAAAVYVKEILSFTPTVSKTIASAANTYAEAALIADALLLTRPEVDRRSLIALKGRRVDGTCEWLTQHPSYLEWLADEDPPLLWISGGPGKGKSMLAIYVTGVLQPVVDSVKDDVLLYYFCSNRDKNRNTALTIMRGIILQWIDLRPELAQHIKHSFEGTERTKSTVSSFASLWRVFRTLLKQSGTSQVVCVLDGLDECEKGSLTQLLGSISDYLSAPQEGPRPRLKLLLFSRPQPDILESTLSPYRQIRLDDTGIAISRDIERYIHAKVAELALDQNLSEERAARVQQTLLTGANDTFLWVGFVANELQGRSWEHINEILLRVPKGLGGVYQRLLQQIDDKEALVPILQWVVLAARPLTVDELTVATGTTASGSFSATAMIRKRLRFCGLLVKIEGGTVNLVHESAKEFFQSDQVNIRGISMFRMSRETHRSLMSICLSHIEQAAERPEGLDEDPSKDPLLSYAIRYWPVHLQYAIPVVDRSTDFSRPFFQDHSPVRDEWWKIFWEHEKNGGHPPSFKLLHLAAYLNNVAWAKMLIHEHARQISVKDNYGRTPLAWAVNRGHEDMVAMLLDHGARVNAKDRSRVTPLHVAVNKHNEDIVRQLLDHGARLEPKSEHGETPLMRAIQANSGPIVRILLEHGASVKNLPIPPGKTHLKGPGDQIDERVEELLGLQEQLFILRYRQASREVHAVMKVAKLSLRVPLILRLVKLYLRSASYGRWEFMFVLQEVVQENRTEELLQWANSARAWFHELVEAKNAEALTAMTDLPAQILQRVAPGDMQALLVITVMVGAECKLAALRQGWREGDAIFATAFSHYSETAFTRNAEEYLHYGIREFLDHFDICIQNGDRKDAVTRTTFLLTTHFAELENKEQGPIDYFSRVVAEFFQGYIGGSHEVELFSDVNQACADELVIISESHDSARLLLLLTSVFQFAQRSQEKGADLFLNIPSASCLVLCHENANKHRWLIGEAVPEAMSTLIAKQAPGPLQKRACKALVECLLIGKQYDLALPAVELRKRVKPHLQSLPEVETVVGQIVGL